MYIIEYEGRRAAYVTATDIEIADWVDRQGGYVVGRWVVCQAVFAQGVAAGRLAGPVTDRRAEYFARCVLMPDVEFGTLAGQEDYVVAGHFDVPIEQVAAKHEDRRLAVLGER